MKKQQLNEIKRMQQLAGITEIKVHLPNTDNDKALGILFHQVEDEYEWDMDAVNNLVKDMGYEDYEEIASEITHYFSPTDEEEMEIFRRITGNPNLQPKEITIGMYKQVIKQEFPS